MIAEWLMERYGWDAVWFLGSNRPERFRHWWNFIGPNTCYIGVWTGPDLDLLCVRECPTATEAEQNLSPAGWTITHAAILSWRKFIEVAEERPSLSPEASNTPTVLTP